MRDIRREMNELVEQRRRRETAALTRQVQTANGAIAQLTEALQRAQTRIDGLEAQEARRTEQLRQGAGTQSVQCARGRAARPGR